MTVALDRVSVTFGETEVVHPVTLEIGDGERFAVMGPSGAGKSTLLRAIAGLEPVAAGRLTIAGVDVTRTPPHKRRVGLMFQDYALFPHLSVGRNITFGLRMAGASPQEQARRLDELTSLVDLTGMEDRNVGSLSGGEQQRVALARTLAPHPDVILLDEPLGSLDQALKDDLLVHMRRIMSEIGTTSVYVTHDRMEAEAYADRMAILRDGSLVRVGTPEEVWNDPGTAFVARFVGHPNVVDGSALDLQHGTVLIPEAAVALDDEGTMTGTASSCVFRDGGYRVGVTVRGIELAITTQRRVSVGDELTLRVDPSSVVPLVDDVANETSP